MIKWKPTKQECNKVLGFKLAIVVTQDYERILIGTTKNILLSLEGKDDVELFYDTIRPFGTFLLTQTSDFEWSTILDKLQRAQTIMCKSKLTHFLYEELVPLEKCAQSMLEEKFDTLDPVSQYIAMRIWYGYWGVRELKNKHKYNAINKLSRNLIRPFSCSSNPYMQGIPITPQNSIFKNCKREDYSDSISVTYTTNTEPSLECILVDNSIIPLERYYKSQIEKYTKYIVECKICKKPFLADNLRFELCSDECRKQAVEESKLQRKEKSITEEIEPLRAATRSHWTRRLDKINKSPEWSAEKVQNYKNAMQDFRKEATSLRNKYKHGKLTTKEFTDWLFLQQEKAEDTLQNMQNKQV